LLNLEFAGSTRFTCASQGLIVTDTYRARVVDGRLEGRLRTSGAVLIEGPKACGKTATAARMAKSVFRLDSDESARALVSTAPEALFGEPTPILFDEWQQAPALWNLIRREVDDRAPERGIAVLTGSATPNGDIQRHTGAGRIARIRMRPMSLFESGVATGQVGF
jgi:predicted AAA+ superfamily ATPase